MIVSFILYAFQCFVIWNLSDKRELAKQEMSLSYSPALSDSYCVIILILILLFTHIEFTELK